MTTDSSILNSLNLLLANPVTLDVETTTFMKGNVHAASNYLVTIQAKQKNEPTQVFFKEDFKNVLPILHDASCIIAANSKFDLGWLYRKLGFFPNCPLWDIQLAEFIFSNQTWLYPDLDTIATNYGLGHKQDLVKQYWDAGVDTPDIPREVLVEYGIQDVELSYAVFLAQVERFKTSNQHQFKLFRVHCADTVVLLEMENNGILYDCDASIKRDEEIQNEIKQIENTLNGYANGAPINWSSRDHISKFLYGGTLVEETRLPIGVYNSGAKSGQPRFKILKTTYDLPRLVEPVKGSELKKEGFYSTDEPTLLSLKPNKTVKNIITLLLERVKLSKLSSTYLQKLPKLIDTMQWDDNKIYSTLNQCVVITGRLSSTKPNQQNFPPEVKTFCISRYP